MCIIVKHQEQLRWCGAIQMPNFFILLIPGEPTVRRLTSHGDTATWLIPGGPRFTHVTSHGDTATWLIPGEPQYTHHTSHGDTATSLIPG